MDTSDILKIKGFQSLISTNTISQGDSRIGGLDFILNNNGLINFAISSTKWPGLAAVNISLITICKDIIAKKIILNGKECDYINSYLEMGKSLITPFELIESENKGFIGSYVLGSGFILNFEERESLISQNSKNQKVIFPFLVGDDINNNPEIKPSRYIINFFDWTEEFCRKEYSLCYDRVKSLVYPERMKTKDKAYRNKWWQYGRRGVELYKSIRNLKRYLVVPLTTKYLTFTYRNDNIVISHAAGAIAFEDDLYFTLLSNTFHEQWAWLQCSTMGGNTLRYTPSKSISSFPFPRKINHIVTANLRKIGNTYHEHRRQLMQNIHLGLTKTYNAFHAPEIQPGITTAALQGKDKKPIEKQYGTEVWNLWNHLQKTPGTRSIEEAIAGIVQLRKLHMEMDNAVLEAYGWASDSEHGPAIQLRHDFYEVDYLPENDRIRFTIHPDARSEVLKRLLELNHKIHEEEVKAGLWNKNKTKDKKLKDKSISTDDSENDELNYREEGEEEQLLEAAEESKSLAFEPGTLFHPAPVQDLKATANCRVVIRNKQGQTFKYHITPKSEKDHYTGDYRQIKPTSPMAKQIIGKRVGDMFKFGEVEYWIERIDAWL